MPTFQIKRILLLSLLACLFAACSGQSVQRIAEDDQPEKPENMLEARMLPKGGSSIKGTITVAAKGKSWRVSVIVTGAPYGDYRVAFFDNGNCTSPNAFSAGKIWMPPGIPEGTEADRWIPLLNPDPATGNAQLTTRLPNPEGHGIDLFHNRSVLIFSGRNAEELAPGVRNDVVACGTFEVPTSLFDPFDSIF